MANEKVYVGEIGAKELYRRIKRLINNFGGFEEAQGTGADNHPNVLNPSTKIIYLVPIDSSTAPNKFTEWYYHIDPTTQAGSWETLGVTSFVENSWKHWSEEHGSTSADSTETSVYIGKNNTITAGSDGNHYVIGAENSLRSGFIFGQSNTASNLRALIVGSSNTSTSYDTIIIGNQNAAADYGSAVFGYSNTLTKGHDCSIFGSENTLNENTANSSQASTIHGRANVARDFYISDLFGSSNQCYQDKTSIFNIKGGHTERNYFTSIFGQSISAYDNRLSSIVGYNNTVSKMFESIVMGVSVNATSLSSSTEGTGNVIIAAYNDEIPIQASHSALVFGYGGSAHGEYNAIFGIAPRVGDTSVSGSAGESNYNAGIAGFSTTIQPQSFTNLFLTTHETINGSNNVVIDQFGHTVGDNNISIGQYNSIGEYTPTKRNSSMAIGKSNNIQRDHATAIGDSNTITFNDNTDYAGTYVSSFGQNNTATNAANAYQIGKNNSVTGNNLDLISNYPHQTAVNLGVYNTIAKEGVNIGKDNSAESFGINLGSDNISRNGSISIGKYANSEYGSIAIGKGSTYTVNGVNVVNWVYATGNSVAFGIGKINTTSSGFAIGYENAEITGHSFGIGLFSRDSESPTTISGGSAGFITDSAGDGTPYGISHITGASIGFGGGLNVSGGSFCVGRSINADGTSLAFGLGCDVKTGSLVCGSSSYVIENGSQVFGKSNALITNGSIVCGISNTTVGFEWTDSKNEKHSGGGNCVLGTSNYNITGGVSVVGQYNSHIYDGAAVVGYNNHNIHNSGWVFGDVISNVYYDGVGIGDEIGNVDTAGVAIGFNLYNINTNGIAIGCRNASVVNSSIAIGTDNNNIWYGSIALGLRNNGYRGALMMGMDNSAYMSQYSEKLHTNSVILGFQNKVLNVREQFKCELDDSDHLRYELACGFVAGSTNCIYGHNPIVIGVHNTVGDETNWYNDDTQASDPTSETDNDGFMTAIGYKCEALRNYDMAIGYMSRAYGGENVALQHSNAEGYRNLAAFDSNINGIANVGLVESALLTPNNSSYSNRTQNMLFASTVTCDDTTVFTKNIALYSGISGAIATSGVRHNIFHTAELTGKAYVTFNNIMFGNSTLTSTITTPTPSQCIFNNMLLAGSRCTYTPDKSVLSGSANSPFAANILFGTDAKNAYNCFSMADGYSESADLQHCGRVFNFGDNILNSVSTSNVLGQKNKLTGAHHSSILGESNTIKSYEQINTDDPRKNIYVGEVYMMGTENTVIHTG